MLKWDFNSLGSPIFPRLEDRSNKFAQSDYRKLFRRKRSLMFKQSDLLTQN
jgi:hypothetical protein